MAFSISGPLIRLPISYFIVGRRDPVRADDLWAVFFRHLPVDCCVLWRLVDADPGGEPYPSRSSAHLRAGWTADGCCLHLHL